MFNEEQKTIEEIKKAKNILIIFNNTDADSVAAALALKLYFQKINKETDIVCEKEIKKNLLFLPAIYSIKKTIEKKRDLIISLNLNDAKINCVKYQLLKEKLNFIVSFKNKIPDITSINSKIVYDLYDLIFIINSPDLDSLGNIFENNRDFFYQIPIINISHKVNSENFGHINLTSLIANSATEIIFNLFKKMGIENMDENIATCLLVGVISETDCFKINNITPNSLTIARELMTMNAKYEEIINHLYRSKTLNSLKLWGIMLSRLMFFDNQQFVWSFINKDDFIKTTTEEDDIIEAIQELISNIPQIKIAVIFFQKINQDNFTYCFIYTNKKFNALELVQEFNPIGSKTLAKISLTGSFKDNQENILNILKEKLKKIF